MRRRSSLPGPLSRSARLTDKVLEHRSRDDGKRVGFVLRLPAEERNQLNRLTHERGPSTNALPSATVRDMLESAGAA